MDSGRPSERERFGWGNAGLLEEETMRRTEQSASGRARPTGPAMLRRNLRLYDKAVATLGACAAKRGTAHVMQRSEWRPSASTAVALGGDRQVWPIMEKARCTTLQQPPRHHSLSRANADPDFLLL